MTENNYLEYSTWKLEKEMKTNVDKSIVSNNSSSE